MGFLRFLVLFILFSVAGASDIREFLTLKASFKQTITNSKATIVYSGEILIDNGSKKALWSYEKPAQKLIYIDVARITIIEPDLEQAILSEASEVPDLNELIKSAKQVSQNHFQTSFDGVLYDIFLSGDGDIAKISYKDKFDNTASIELFDTILDSPISQNLLTPNIPNGYDIVKN